MFDITQFREDILAPTLNALQFRDPAFLELLVFTCAAESAGGTYVKQIKGPALGIFQLEPATFTDCWVNYVVRKPDIINLLSLNLAVHRMPQPVEMITDLKLAVAMAALLYKQRKAAPKDIEIDTLWNLYKELWNTPKGKAEKEPCLKAYKRFIKA